MIHILYGDDDFSLSETVKGIKNGIGPSELLEANTSALQGSQLTLSQLAATCDTIPFLSEKRLVIVDGLLSFLEERASRRRGGGSIERDSHPSQWEGLPEYLQRLPATCELVFREGRLGRDNPLLGRIRPLARVLEFPSLAGEGLRRWVRERVALKGGKITPGSVRLLAELVGSNLWIMDCEIEKLCLYAWGRTIEEVDVRALVPSSRESSIFAAVDAVLEGRPAVAIRLIYRLMQSGEAASRILLMLARQVRLLILAKELKKHGVSGDEVGRRLGIRSAFALRKTVEQEGRFSGGRLMEFHRKLLEADLAIKTGTLAEGTALDLLVAQLCGARQTPVGRQPY